MLFAFGRVVLGFEARLPIGYRKLPINPAGFWTSLMEADMKQVLALTAVVLAFGFSVLSHQATIASAQDSSTDTVKTPPPAPK